MATTTQIAVTKAWVKLSDSDCTVQANSNEQLQFSMNATAPITDAALLLRISEPVTFAYKTPVWCRLPPSSYTRDESIVVNIVK